MIKIADMGCADSGACLGYIRNLREGHDFEYLGIDINDKFLEDAQQKISNEPSVKKATLIKGDILTDGLTTIPKENYNNFDIIFVSHLAYYLKDKDYSLQFMKNMNQLLNKNGMAIFLHEDSTYYFRSTFNSNYKNINAPEILRASAETLNTNTEFNEISFTSKLIFKEMTNKEWEALKEPANYKRFSHLPHIIDNLNKLSFIVQCDLLTLKQEGTLERFIDEIKERLSENNHCFDLTTTMQVLVRPENKKTKDIEAALKALQASCQTENQAQQSTPVQLCYS